MDEDEEIDICEVCSGEGYDLIGEKCNWCNGRGYNVREMRGDE